MKKLMIVKASVEYPSYIDLEEVEDHMLSHKGITRFSILPDEHVVVVVIDKKKTNWAKTKHDMEEEGLDVKGVSVTGMI